MAREQRNDRFPERTMLSERTNDGILVLNDTKRAVIETYLSGKR
ncbi:hypothetical protein [Haladaptatus sp. NG-WS-4]